MKLTKLVLEPREKIRAILCNRCGKSCKRGGDASDWYGLTEVEVTGGYYSCRNDADGPGLGDGNRYAFSLCESCLLVLFKDFKLDPLVSDYIHGDSYGMEAQCDQCGHALKYHEGGTHCFASHVVNDTTIAPCECEKFIAPGTLCGRCSCPRNQHMSGPCVGDNCITRTTGGCQAFVEPALENEA